MRRIRDPLGYQIRRIGHFLRVKLNLSSNVRGLSRPAGPPAIRWTQAARETGAGPGREACRQSLRPTPATRNQESLI